VKASNRRDSTCAHLASVRSQHVHRAVQLRRMRSSTDGDARPAVIDDPASVARVLHDARRARRLPATTLAGDV